MAVPAEPNAEALPNLIQVQGQGQRQPLLQDQQVQAQEQQPQVPPGTTAAQGQVGKVFCVSPLFIFLALHCTSSHFLPLAAI